MSNLLLRRNPPEPMRVTKKLPLVSVPDGWVGVWRRVHAQVRGPGRVGGCTLEDATQLGLGSTDWGSLITRIVLMMWLKLCYMDQP